MRLLHFAPVAAFALIIAACSGGGPVPSSPAVTQLTPPGETSGQTLEVALTDALRMEPAEMVVKIGQPVTFVVTNTGAIEHEFVLGDEEAQAEQEALMQSGEMMHGTPEAITLAPGETKELTYTFTEPGQTLAGCHVTGHYAAGMKASITVTE